MNYYLRLLGALLVGVGAILLLRGYEKYLTRRLEEYRGLISLIGHADGEISKFLTYGSRLFRHFSCEALERCGLLSAIAEEGGLYSAFIKCKSKMSLSTAAKEKLAVTDDELEAEYALLASNYNMELDQVKELAPADMIKEDIKTKKAMQFVKDAITAPKASKKAEPAEVEAEA